MVMVSASRILGLRGKVMVLLPFVSLGRVAVSMRLVKTRPNAEMSFRSVVVLSLALVAMLVVVPVCATVRLNRLELTFTMMPVNTRTKWWQSL